MTNGVVSLTAWEISLGNWSCPRPTHATNRLVYSRKPVTSCSLDCQERWSGVGGLGIHLSDLWKISASFASWVRPPPPWYPCQGFQFCQAPPWPLVQLSPQLAPSLSANGPSCGGIPGGVSKPSDGLNTLLGPLWPLGPLFVVAPKPSSYGPLWPVGSLYVVKPTPCGRAASEAALHGSGRCGEPQAGTPGLAPWASRPCGREGLAPWASRPCPPAPWLTLTLCSNPLKPVNRSSNCLCCLRW